MSLKVNPSEVTRGKEFRNTPPFILDRRSLIEMLGEAFRGVLPKLNKNKDKILGIAVMTLRTLLVSIHNSLLASNLNRNNHLKGKIIKLNRQPNWRNKTSDGGGWLGKK